MQRKAYVPGAAVLLAALLAACTGGSGSGRYCQKAEIRLSQVRWFHCAAFDSPVVPPPRFLAWRKRGFQASPAGPGVAAGLGVASAPQPARSGYTDGLGAEYRGAGEAGLDRGGSAAGVKVVEVPLLRLGASAGLFDVGGFLALAGEERPG